MKIENDHLYSTMMIRGDAVVRESTIGIHKIPRLVPNLWDLIREVRSFNVLNS
jgi:hypothetical protein